MVLQSSGLWYSVFCACACSVTESCLTLCDPMGCQPPLSIGFSRKEYWSGLPFPSPGDIPDPGIEFLSPALQVDSCIAHKGSPWIPEITCYFKGLFANPLFWLSEEIALVQFLL